MDNKKVALVTGSSRGIGKDIAIRLAKAGINVVINYRSSEEEALKVKEECENLGVRALAIKANLVVEEEVKELFKNIIDEFSKLDILVNNAGITRDGLIMLMTEDKFKEVLEGNLVSTFHCSKLASKLMLKKKSGVIINISSVVGLRGNPGQSNYSASKAGIIGFTKSLAKELSPRNIRVNAVAPGFIETDMTSELSEKQVGEVEKIIPLGRMGLGEDVANLVNFLASDESSYITGQVISVDGGMNI